MNSLSVKLEKRYPFVIFLHAMPFLGASQSILSNFESDVKKYLDSGLESYKKEYNFKHYKEAKGIFLDFYDALSEEDSLCFYKNPIEKIYHNLILQIPKFKKQRYVVVSCDKNGGYGYKDHLKVHELGQYLKKLHSGINLFEITINRTKMEKWLNSSSFKLSPQEFPKIQF